MNIDNLFEHVKEKLSPTEKQDISINYENGTLFTIDRFEENIAVCENRKTGKMVDIPKDLITALAKEGDIIKFEDGSFVLDKQNTDKEKAEIEEMLKKLKNN